MNSGITPDARGQAVREMLVAAAADASTARPRTRMSRRTLVATVSAFTLAGALTGGAVSAMALTADTPESTVVDIDTSTRQASLGDSTPLGTPFTYTGTGDTVLRIGPPPEGATGFVYRLGCLEPGEFVITVDGDTEHPITTSCDDEAASSPSGGSGGQITASVDAPATLSIESSARYSVWGTWAAEPAPPTPSAAQKAEMADGVVTHDEYVMAYQRFSACMSEAGFPLAFVDLSGTIIDYSTTQESETDGASPRCYGREFELVDTAWQVANQDSSETARFYGECLEARGITPAPTLDEKLAQLKAAGIPLDGC